VKEARADPAATPSGGFVKLVPHNSDGLLAVKKDDFKRIEKKIKEVREA
jgi:hypothetical protein